MFATDAFMRAALSGDDFPLINPRTGAIVRTVSAAELLQHIAANAWATGDPGILYCRYDQSGQPDTGDRTALRDQPLR